MKRVLLFFFCIMLPATAVFGQNRTYYYELVAQVNNGNKTTASGDGHYLTVNSKVLYESDRNGLSMGKGTMNFEGDSDGLHRYGGNSYLGNDVTYYFASDYSRLNVRLHNGTILVYERKSQANSSRMRRYEQSDGGYIPTVSPNSSSSGGVRSGNKTGNDYSEVTCTYCRGTGKETVTRSINVTGSTHQVWTTCSECGLRYDSKATSHHHQMCGHCNGRGKQRVR